MERCASCALAISWIAIIASLPTAVASASSTGSNVIRVEQGADGQHTTTTLGPANLIAEGPGILGGPNLRPSSTSDVRPVIVELSAPPTSIALRRGAALDGPARQHASLRSDLARLRNTDAHGASGSGTVHRWFAAAFNGAAMMASTSLVKELRRLPYVVRVVPDDSVHVTLSESVPLIRADQAWALGATGAGVIVSIIDTGIDYRVPALGGGWGPRVVAGYDFANNDPDPLDDHGHGTHVAGIVGANSPGLKGVAPDVTFHAYKALSAGGSGLESWIIAAIEASVDPDGNPLTDDHVDVINMSLSGPGDADSPLSLATDQAVESGVVCVVAAGNTAGYFTVGTPASARRAITVGASTKSDMMASFSSRGPTASEFQIKPDLVAPGVSITSTGQFGGLVTMSGTSMAAPHVAGVAAQLLDLHPTWTPDLVESAMVSSTVDLGQDPFIQGAGRVDALAAAQAGFVLAGGPLSFGLAVIAPAVWASEETLRVVNVSNAPLMVSLSVVASLPSGASVTLIPSTVNAAAGQSVPVRARLVLNHATVPYAETKPYAYHGTVVATAGPESHRVPFAFLKAPQLTVSADEPEAFLVIHDRELHGATAALTNGHATVLLPTDTYDVCARFLWMPFHILIIREGIPVADSSHVAISVGEDYLCTEIAPVDEQGEPLTADVGVDAFVHVPSGLIFNQLSGNPMPSVGCFSHASTDYAWVWVRQTHTVNQSRVYTVSGVQRGFDENLQTLTNSPDSLRHLIYEFRTDPGVDSVVVLSYLTNAPDGVVSDGFRLTGGFAVYHPKDPPLGRPFIQHAYITPPPDIQVPGLYKNTNKIVYEHERPFQAGADNRLLETPYLVLHSRDNARGYFTTFEGGVEVSRLTNEHANVGFAPPSWFGRFENVADQMTLVSAILGRQGWFFLTQQSNWSPHPDLPYVLERAGVPVDSGTFSGSGVAFGTRVVKPLVPGPHTLRVTNTLYRVASQPGIARVVATFDTQLPDKDPPFLTAVNVLANGVVADVIQLEPLQERVVSFTLQDALGPVSAELSFRLDATTTWTPLALTQLGSEFSASLPDTAIGYIHLRIVGEDAAGNLLTYTMEPALYVDPGITAVDPGGTSVRPVLALAGATPNPAMAGLTVSFSLPDRDAASLELFDLAGRSVRRRDVGALGPGRHVVALDAARSLRPGVYLLRLRHGERTITTKACVLR